jgi:hypothetical protein
VREVLPELLEMCPVWDAGDTVGVGTLADEVVARA